MTLRCDITGYGYSGPGVNRSHRYLLPRVLAALDSLAPPPQERRLFDLGCGNGSVAAALSERGWQVTGVDPSAEGIQCARSAYPHLALREGSCYEDLAARFGTFPVVTCLEVIEHVYGPRELARCVRDLLEPGGWAIISTPYHGYWKNLALAATGRLDAHFAPLWDHGHIKFWSRRTLSQLLTQADLHVVRFAYAGRFRPFARSMIALVRR
jgi:2-polyprenyl-3-methyl-5-hydroxy-6-metoxy-1,4-benzoquinol methylase